MANSESLTHDERILLTCPKNVECTSLDAIQRRTDIDRIEQYPGQIEDKISDCNGIPSHCVMARYAINRLAQGDLV